MKYVLYFRVSTKRQGESGLGLEAQRTYINHFYSGKEVIADFTETVSGKDVANRPELQKAINLCKKEKAVLVVAKIDRLSRSTEQALWIYKELDGKLESCDIPNLDKFTLTLFMAIADRERELIGLRTKAALDEKRKKTGEWRNGSKDFKKGLMAHIGVIAIKEKAAANTNNKRAASLVRELRTKTENGRQLTWREIADRLNANDFKTSKGKSFQATQAMRIFKKDLGK